jgi:hypothetical protein
LFRVLVPLAAYAALTSLARFQVNPTAAAETAYLAFIAAGVLLAIGSVAVKPELEAGLAALLAVTIVWVLPAGPGRGAMLTLLLTAALGATVLRRLARDEWRPAWGSVVPAAVALQILWRADALLTPRPLTTTAVDLLVLPCLGAVGVVTLAARRRPESILAATAALLILGEGWSPVGVVTLLVVATVDHVGKRPAPRLELLLLAVTLATAVAVAPAARGWTDSLHLMAWLPILAPAAIVALPERPSHGLAAVILLAAGARLIEGPEALSVPVAFALLVLSPASHRMRETQALWSGCLLLAGTVLAGYPWLRIAPADSLLRTVGLQPGWAAAAAIVAIALLIGSSWWDRLDRGSVRASTELMPGPVPSYASPWLRPAPLVGFVLLVAAAFALPPAGPAFLRQLQLTAGDPTVISVVEPAVPVSAVALDSYLSYGTLLAPGAPVARLRLRGTGGQIVVWTLRNGRETGEWAVRRPDIATSSTQETPVAWVSWVTARRLFFGQRYRAVHLLPEPLEVDRVELTLEPGVAPEVVLTLVRLEMRP